MTTTLSDIDLDALRELANIGSGNAATALSLMVGRPIDVSLPKAIALPLADAVEAAGDPESLVTAVVLPVDGDLQALVVLLFTPEDAASLAHMLGVDPDSELGQSALGEVGNIIGSSYIGALGAVAGMELLPHPPQTIVDMLGAILSSALVTEAADSDVAILLDSDLIVEDSECGFTFVLVPAGNAVDDLLARLGLRG